MADATLAATEAPDTVQIATYAFAQGSDSRYRGYLFPAMLPAVVYESGGVTIDSPDPLTRTVGRRWWR